MEDEELLDSILEMLYKYSGGVSSVRATLNQDGKFFRKNQLNRVMGDIKNNGFALVSRNDDDYQAQISPEGVVYCEETLMLR